MALSFVTNCTIISSTQLGSEHSFIGKSSAYIYLVGVKKEINCDAACAADSNGAAKGLACLACVEAGGIGTHSVGIVGGHSDGRFHTERVGLPWFRACACHHPVRG